MTELLFIFTIFFIFYVVYMILNPKPNQKEQAKREQQNEPDKRSDEDILGLSRKWTQEDLKAAYRHKCNQLHPDKWEKMPKQMQTIMENEFKAVQQSYKNLLK